jgi:hypothetical protein
MVASWEDVEEAERTTHHQEETHAHRVFEWERQVRH